MVRPSDFVLRETGTADVDVVLRNPNLSLYCVDLDRHTGLFVETPPDIDLDAAPFLYMAQREHALRVVSLPLDALASLAEQMPFKDSDLILVYSVGRCGSTLVSHAFGAADGVASLSEPDALTQLLGLWGYDTPEGEGRDALLRACLRIQCAPSLAKGANRCALKFRSSVTRLAGMVHRRIPNAKIVFVYRCFIPWAKSFLRMTGASDLFEAWDLSKMAELFGKGFPRFDGRNEVSALEIFTAQWASHLQEAQQLASTGVPMFMVRYEEIQADPVAVLNAMFEFCGLPAVSPETLREVLSKDSQEGTLLSQENVKSRAMAWDDGYEAKLIDHLRQCHPALSASPFLPGTFSLSDAP